MNETAAKIVDIAERMIREGGYHAFSFRQIATELGIKSASIHYHFPSKADLGIAVAERYTGDFLKALGAPESHDDPIGFYVSAFEQSLETHQRACLCGILASESGRLPAPLLTALESFTQMNLDWLETAVANQQVDWSAEKVKDTALVLFSALEGAITFSALSGEPARLKQVGKRLREFVA